MCLSIGNSQGANHVRPAQGTEAERRPEIKEHKQKQQKQQAAIITISAVSPLCAAAADAAADGSGCLGSKHKDARDRQKTLKQQQD